MPVTIVTPNKVELIDVVNKESMNSDKIYSQLVYYKLLRVANTYASQPRLVLQLNELLTQKANFPMKYKNVNDVPLVNDIMVKWVDFRDEVLKCNYSEEFIVLNFIHRYSLANLRWFLTVECCEREHDPATHDPDLLTINGTDHYIHKIINRGHRFDIDNGSVSPTTFTGGHDPEYFEKVLFEGAALVEGEYVNSVMFPWKQELVKLHDDNELDDAEDVFIKFSSATADFGPVQPPPAGFDTRETLVAWPNGLLIYMNKAGADYLNNFQEATIFSNKGCNYGSMCPPRCNDYFWLEYLPMG